MHRSLSTIVRRFALLCGVLTTTALNPGHLEAQELTAPYSFDEVAAMLAGPQSQERIASLVADGCIDFELDAFVILDLQDLGADDDLISALSDACVTLPGSETATPSSTRSPEAAQTPAVEEDEPVVVRSSTPARSFTGSGFYGSDSRFGLQYSSFGDTKTLETSWATMTSGSAEFGLWGTGAQTVTADPAIGELTLWDAETGMLLNLFLMQPRPSRPLGLYFGGRASFARSWAEEAFGDGLNRYQYGWEGGAFGRIGTNDLALIPRVAHRWAKNQYVSDVVEGEFIVRTTILGAEAKLAGFVPGVFVHIADGTSVTVISVTFAF